MTPKHDTAVHPDAAFLSDSRFLLFYHLPDPVIVTDPEGQILDFNPAATEFFNIASDTLKQSAITDFYVNAQDHVDFCRQTEKDGVVLRLPTVFMDYHKNPKNGFITLMRLGNPDQALSGYQCVIHIPISQKTEADEKQTGKHGDLSHRTLLEAVPDPVIAMDMNDRVIYMNPAFTRTFGWTLESCRNQTISFYADHSDSTPHLCTPQLKPGESFSCVESRCYTQNGKPVDVSISGATFFDEDHQLKGYINTLQDITCRRKKDAELHHAAYHDSLTNLPNRKSFYMTLDDLLHHGPRRSSDGTWALMFLDLDKFKQINDVLGHDIGDLLLKETAERIRKCLRETDHLFRLGGDEFTIILTSLGNNLDVTQVAQKILRSIGQSFSFKGHEVFTSTSIGISLFPNDGWDVESLVKNADMAMYAAKEKGGSNYQFFTQEMNRKAVNRVKMEIHLKKALENNELLLYYQPLMDASNHIVGMEALIRWNHPELGLVMPSEFIRLMEDTGMIIPIGKWVLTTACTQVKLWQDMGFSDLFVSVNISPRQLQEPDFEIMIMQIVKESGILPRSLKLEITECCLSKNPDVYIAKMKILREDGVAFVIDDFGTGGTSLNYLKEFPVDALKIDQAFVSDALKSARDQEIVKTIIAMAQNLNIQAVAKGVETVDQVAFLTRHACGNMQGYLFSKPVPMEQFKALLESQGIRHPSVISSPPAPQSI